PYDVRVLSDGVLLAEENKEMSVCAVAALIGEAGATGDELCPGGKLQIDGDRAPINIGECYGYATRLTLGAGHREGDFAEVPSSCLGKLDVVEVVNLAFRRSTFGEEHPYQRGTDTACPAHHLDRFIDRVAWQPDVPVVIPVMEDRENRHHFRFSCRRRKRATRRPWIAKRMTISCLGSVGVKLTPTFRREQLQLLCTPRGVLAVQQLRHVCGGIGGLQEASTPGPPPHDRPLQVGYQRNGG